MNPTGRNVSSVKSWRGIRAPWLGTKNIWALFFELGLIPKKLLGLIQSASPRQWTPEFSENLYCYLADRKIYVTNLAKCTQIDARPLKDQIFKEYLSLMKEEIAVIRPKHIVTFGNQVSSIILGKSISVGQHKNNFEILEIGSSKYRVYPTHYPVGHGRMNQPLAVARINKILNAK